MKRRIAITGAAGGIGRATCAVLAERGHALLLIDLPGSGVEALAREHGAPWSDAPIGTAAGAARALSAAAGPIDGLVHLAGAMEDDPSLGDDPDVWSRMIDANLANAYAMATAMGARLPQGRMGRMVFTSSLAFRRGAVDAVAYSAAKGGLVGLTRALARRYRTQATVNALAPGIIETAMPAQVIARRGEQLRREIPLGRFGAPREVATVIAFLLGEDASYVTGQTINVDGGQIMT